MSNLHKAFSAIYDQYVNKIYRFIFLKVNSEEIAEDLTSEVFLRGWEAYKESQKIENIQAFLYKIARNLIVDHYREKDRAQMISAEHFSIADEADLREGIFLRSDLEQIKKALANIKEEYREIIVWYYLDELSIPEIAKILDKSEEAVRVQLHRALKALKNKVADLI